MKTIKIMLLFSTIFFFTSAPFVAEAKDCSHLKKLHKKLMCSAGSDKYDSGASTTSVQVKKKKGESFNEKYNSFADFFKKKK